HPRVHRIPRLMSDHPPLDPRLTEQRNPATTDIDRLSALEIVRIINDEDHRVAPAVAGQLEQVAAAVDMAEDTFRRGGRLVYVGAKTGFLLCTPPQDWMLEVYAVVIAPLVGPEVVTGSTRMKAGTATKLVLNMISTGAMIRLGKVYGNLMVDLRATNQKLQDRS